MAYVKQRGRLDCGVAALAMLCNVTYDEANVYIPWRREGLLYGTSTSMLAAGAKRLGYSTRGTKTGRLVVVKRPVTVQSWLTIPDNSLVKIRNTDDQNHSWHWVVWRKKKVYDPARGVFRPVFHGGLPSSYMEFYHG